MIWREMMDAGEDRGVHGHNDLEVEREGKTDEVVELRSWDKGSILGGPILGKDDCQNATSKPLTNSAEVKVAVAKCYDIGSLTDRDDEAATASNASTNSDDANALDKPMRCLSAYNLFYQFARDKIVCGELDFDFRTLTPEMVDESANRSMGRKRNWRKHRASHGVIGFAELARAIASWWRDLDPAVKALFKARAQLEKEKYVDALAEWKQALGGEANARKKPKRAIKSRRNATEGKMLPHSFPSPEFRLSNSTRITGHEYGESSMENSPAISPIHFEPSAEIGYDPSSQNDQVHAHNTYSLTTQHQLPARIALPHSALWSNEMTVPLATSARTENAAPPIATPSFERPSLKGPSAGIGLPFSFAYPTSHVASQDLSQWNSPLTAAPASMSTMLSTDTCPYPMHFENHGFFEQPQPHAHLLHPTVYPMMFPSQQPLTTPGYQGTTTVGQPLGQESANAFRPHVVQQNGVPQFLGGSSVLRYF